MNDVIESVWNKFTNHELMQKVTLGELICKLLKNDPDPRAPGAIERLQAEMVGIKAELEKRGNLADLTGSGLIIQPQKTSGKPAPIVIGMQTLNLKSALVPAG